VPSPNVALAGSSRTNADGKIDQGLQSHGCTIEQVPSFITDLPTGLETGTYLAVDLGGTNIRVCSVTFHGDGTHSLVQDKMVIPVELMTSKTSKGLFNLVARSVQGFLRTHHPESLTTKVVNDIEERRIFDLGFTFSHAVNQLDINSGTLIRWSKGFDIDGVVGQDICALLQNELTELVLPVRVTALINDTVGTLMARAYASPNSAHTVLGAVFGTGTNGAYVEKASKITKLHGSAAGKEGIMIVNSEWGNFDQALEYLPTTAYDKAIDIGSVNPGVEMFEKRISGMYLGEILRLVILCLIEDPKVDLFSGSRVPEKSRLHVQWGLDSSFMSHLESDITPDLSASIAELEQCTGIKSASLEDIQTLRIISHAIGRRSARLSAVALGAVIVQTGCLGGEDGERVDIGVDGSLIELYPGFIDEMRSALKEIPQIGEGEKRVDVAIAKDGSGVGAALAAHVAARHLNC
jgi:hexokinase